MQWLSCCLFFFFVGKSGLNGLERLRVVSQFIIICDSWVSQLLAHVILFFFHVDINGVDYEIVYPYLIHQLMMCLFLRHSWSSNLLFSDLVKKPIPLDEPSMLHSHLCGRTSKHMLLMELVIIFLMITYEGWYIFAAHQIYSSGDGYRCSSILPNF